MIRKNLKTKVISGLVSLSMIAGLYLPTADMWSVNVANAADTEEGLVAHWTFDDNYNDSASGLTTNLGAKNLTYTEGIFGKAAVFNGKDNYLYVDADTVLNLGNSLSESNNNFTISAWINLGDAVSGDKFLLDKGKNIGWDGDFFYSNPYQVKFDGNEPIVNLDNNYCDYSQDPDIVQEGSCYTSGKYAEGEEWFLLTVTYDGKFVKIYRDNEVLNQSSYTDGISFNNDELYIGVDSKLESYFKGAVDDLRIYKRTLSYDDVNQSYQKGVSSNKEFVEPTKQLVAYYDFDGNLEDGSTFKNDAERVAASGTSKYVVGKNGQAITLSKGTYLLVPATDQLNPGTEFSVSFWIKSDKEGQYPILYRQNPAYKDDNDNDYTYKLELDSWGSFENTSLTMSTRAYDPSSWSDVSGQYLSTDFSYDDSKIKSNNWFHFTFTYKDGQLKSYLNGELQDKTDASDIIDIANATGDLLIGYDGDTFINGAIDELKIYNSCLSATDVEKEAKRIDSINLSTADVKKISAIGKGKSIQISAVQLKDADTGKTSSLKAIDENLSYKSSNKKIFTVTNDGKLKGVKAGKAKLTVTYGGSSITYAVQVK